MQTSRWGCVGVAEALEGKYDLYLAITLVAVNHLHAEGSETQHRTTGPSAVLQMPIRSAIGKFYHLLLCKLGRWTACMLHALYRRYNMRANKSLMVDLHRLPMWATCVGWDAPLACSCCQQQTWRPPAQRRNQMPCEEAPMYLDTSCLSVRWIARERSQCKALTTSYSSSCCASRC